MAYKLQLKRGASGSLPTGSAGEPLFTTDTNDLYIGTGAANQRYQKYIASGTSSQFLKGDGSLDSNTYYLASNPSAYIALTALTASSPLSYNNTTGAFTIAQASGSANGYLSSTDWTTFNNKQNTLTNPVTGTGTTNYLPKWTSGSALGNSAVTDDGTTVSLVSRALSGTSGTFTGNMNADDYNMAAWKILDWNGGVAQIGGISASQWTQLDFYTGGSIRASLTSTGLGIGTTSPLGQLDVYTGTFNRFYTSYPDAYTSRWNLGVNGFIQQDANIQELRIAQSYTGSFSAMTFYMGASERMRLNASGNLGLGVVPSAWNDGFVGFEIKNSANNLSANGGSYFEISQNATWNSGWKYVNTARASRYEQGLGEHFWFTAPSGTAGNAISFTQAMTLDASGRLGIGNTNPGSYNAGVNNLVVGNLSGYTGITISSGSAQEGNINFADGLTGGELYRGVITYNHASDSMYFYTLSNERLRITSGGSVGIGTSSPSEKIDISGTGDIKAIVQTTSSGTGANSAVVVKTAADGYWLMQTGNAVGGGLRFYDGTANSERLRITSGGNVGINTSSPLAKLHIAGELRNNFSSGVGGTNYLNIIDGVSNGFQTTITSGNAITYTFHNGANAGVLTLAESGAATFSSSVSAATEYRLNTNSYSRVAILDAGGAIAGGYNFNINGGTAQHDSTGALSAYYYNSAGYISFYTNSSQSAGTAAQERLRITSGGDLGLGTSSPIGRFSVVGSAAGAGIFDVNTDATRVDIQSYNKPLAINRQGNSTSLNSGGGNVLIGTATDGASKVRIVGLPTSATGLSSGDIWNDGGTLKIV
jgi:hypothetical protein